MVHTLLLAVSGLAVFGGYAQPSGTSPVGLLASHTGYGAVLDESAAAGVAANLASQTALVFASDVSQQANTLKAQVVLPTAGDESLAKRQVVATAGDATRGILNYTVSSGDTLSSIARQFNVTTSTIKWANSIESIDSIKPGQALVILPTTGILHTVAASDTPEALATRYQANAAQIISYNNAENGLKVGAKIIIPEGTKVEAPKPAVAPSRFASVFVPRSFGGIGNSYSYGYCTWYVASRRGVPAFWTHARAWYYNAQASGFATGQVPAVGAIAWRPWGGGGFGHVAIVESVNGDGTITISDMNGPAGWGRVATYRASVGEYSGYIY